MLIYFLAVWQYQSNRRKFFKDYAQTHGFDPLIPANWYKHKEKILSTKVLYFVFVFVIISILFLFHFFLKFRFNFRSQGVLGVLYYYKNSLTRALMKFFPNIGLIKARLRVARSHNGAKRCMLPSF